MIDIARHLSAVHREVSAKPETETVRVLLRRSYEAEVDDVWSAVTDPERVRRWFLPLTGDLRVGGTFQLEGHAGGDILDCEPPRLLRVTFGGPTSIVELRLTSGGERGGTTVLELDHSVPLEMAGSAAGALYVGPGWDGAVMGLGLFLAGEVIGDPVAMANSLEVQEFSLESLRLWAAIARESNSATEDEIAAATEVSAQQFAPALVAAKDSAG
ncbi:MAG TPA: SRPBCC family protein [Nakamurella sp.]|nr:SRPBCC family protein [Nakamurella sp.]